MLQRKSFSVLSLALTLALAAAPKPLAGFLLADSAHAQNATPSSFPLPSSVPNGTTIRVDGSETMAAINQALKQRFEAQYAGTTVDLATQGTDAALQAVLDRTIDLAAIGRPLTDAERSQGLVEVPISREKIAIITSANNPFQGELTFEQFAQMFRGEIRDWAEVGGPPGPIQFVDHPESSDTRKALSNYSVFRAAPFTPGPDTVQAAEDSTATVVSQLGENGISYVIASQVLERNDVRIVPMHGTLPDDPRYPYSQPRSYVYREAASPAVQAFLGYATSPAGQQAVTEAQAAAVAAAPLPAASPSPAASPNPAASPEAASPAVPPASPQPTLAQDPNATATGTGETRANWLPWLLLPLLGVIGLLLWGLRGRNSGSALDEPDLDSPSVEPPADSPTLAARTGSVVAADRSTLPGRATPAANPAVEAVATPEPEVSSAEITSPEIVSSGTASPNLTGQVVAAGAGAAALAGLAAGGRNRRSRIVLTPRTSDQGYVYWETPEEEKAVLRQQGGEQLKLRIADVTGLDLERPLPQFQEYTCIETEQDRFVALPQVDRDYLAELGYVTADGRWLMLARSAPVRLSAAFAAATPPTPIPSNALAEATPAIPAPEAPPAAWNVEPDLSLTAEERTSEEPAEDEELTASQPPFIDAETTATGAVTGAIAAGTASLLQNVGNVEGETSQVYEPEDSAQVDIEATKFDVGQADLSSEGLASVDESLPDLPDGYGESWITLLPRDPQWAYAYWDVPDHHRQTLRQQGGQRLALRFYDVTDVDLSYQNPHSLQQYECDELARDWYIPVPISDRDYIVEIGYVAEDGRWLMLARSNAVRIPPIYPVDWYEEQFITVDWNDELQGQTFLELAPPGQKGRFDRSVYERMFDLAESAEAQRIAGSLYGSMQQVPQEAVSSFALAAGSGAGVPTASGVGMSGMGMSGVGMSGVGMSVPTTSGIGMSGIGLYGLSGVGMAVPTMSGMGLYSLSGVGMAARTESGIGIMSGVGMYTTSGMGMYTTSGVGLYSMSGVGMYTASGMGMAVPTMSGVGMYSLSGAGMMSGVGMMSGIGMMSMAVPTESGIGMMSGIGMYSMSGVGLYSMSGAGLYSMSGIGMMSGVGFSASMPPLRSRRFWLIADAELIVYGATEPDATVTIAGRPVQLNPDGTFRFQMSFQDGLIDFPIMAVAADGEQTRSVHLRFMRETPSRHTNTREEAEDQPF